MNLQRVMAIARKNLRSLKHDRRTVGFIVLMPLLLITLFGYTFGGEIKDLKVQVVNLDVAPAGTSISTAIVTSLEGRDVLSIERIYTAETGIAEARAEVEDADIYAVIVFERNFTAEVVSTASSEGGVPVPISVIMDGTNPNIAQAIINEIQAAVRMVLEQSGIAVPITIASELVYGEGAEFIDFFAPGVMGLAAMLITFMLSIVSFIHERTTHTLERLLATPATEGDVVAGYALAFGLVGLMQSCVILGAGLLLFQIQVVGSTLLALLVIFLLGVGHQGLGFVLSSRARSEFQAIQFIPLILFPSILLSGVFWPIEAVPSFLRPVSLFLPLTYAIEGCRSVMIRGWGIGQIWPQVVVLLLFALAMLLLSTWSLKRRR